MCEAQKLVAQAADLLSAIHSSIQHGIQSQNDTTKGGKTITLSLWTKRTINTHQHLAFVFNFNVHFLVNFSALWKNETINL